MKIKDIQGVFKPPKKTVYFGRKLYGAPYFTPKAHVAIVRVGLGWKDKYGTPRYEWSPQFHIFFFRWQFCIWWNAPKLKGEKFPDNDLYYEMVLWYLYYSNKDIDKARSSWEWIDSKTKESSWNDKYLI